MCSCLVRKLKHTVNKAPSLRDCKKTGNFRQFISQNNSASKKDLVFLVAIYFFIRNFISLHLEYKFDALFRSAQPFGQVCEGQFQPEKRFEQMLEGQFQPEKRFEQMLKGQFQPEKRFEQMLKGQFRQEKRLEQMLER
jgi:hypothetical protein